MREALGQRVYAGCTSRKKMGRNKEQQRPEMMRDSKDMVLDYGLARSRRPLVSSA